MALLSKAALLKAGTFKFEDVDVPSLGTVRVQEMSGIERGAFENDMQASMTGEKVNTLKMREALLSRTIVDEDGALMFTVDETRKFLKNHPSEVTDTIFKAAMRINGLSEEAKAEIAKN